MIPGAGKVNDVFEGIHKLLKERKYQDALHMLLDSTQTSVRPSYQEDINHACYIAGDIFFKNKDYDRAAIFFRKSIEDFPDDSQALHALANCYMEMGELQFAKEAYESALFIDPENFRLKYNYANCLFDIGENIKAKKIYQSIPESAGDVYWLSMKNLKKIK